MALKLLSVSPLQGLAWVRQSLATWASRPIGFIGLYIFGYFTILFTALALPFIGPWLAVSLVPLISLGFMIATRSAMQGGAVHALQLFEGLRHHDPARRKAQALLCASYGLCVIGVAVLADWAAGGLASKVAPLMSRTATDEQIRQLMSDPAITRGMVVFFGSIAVLSLPYWHAPALVHWGGQSIGQALFSSTVALWRTKGAFAMYLLGWLGLCAAMVSLSQLLSLVPGLAPLAGVLLMPAALVLTAAFYVSQWLVFRDTFTDPGWDLDSAGGPAEPA